MNLDSGYYAGVAAAGSNEYFAMLFCPPAHREELRSLLAFEKLMNDLSLQSMDPEVRQAKLGWWAGELARLQDDNPVHPVTSAASRLLKRADVSCDPMLALFSALVRESGDALPANPQELLEHVGERGAIVPLFAQLLLAPDALSDSGHKACVAIGGTRYLQILLGAGHRKHQQHQLAHEQSGTDRQTLEDQLVQQQLQAMLAALPEVSGEERRRLVPVMVLARLLHDKVEPALGGPDSKPASQWVRLVRAWQSARRASRGKLPFPISED